MGTLDCSYSLKIRNEIRFTGICTTDFQPVKHVSHQTLTAGMGYCGRKWIDGWINRYIYCRLSILNIADFKWNALIKVT